jgi:hypothetical protein
MNYSTCLMALVTSQVQQLQQEAQESLQPHLQRIAERLTAFFGGGAVARRGVGL